MEPLVLAARTLAARPSRSPIRLLEPPFCSGAWRGPRVDLPILAARVKAARAAGAWAVVLTDIPDDDASLVDALEDPGVLGALAVGCGWLDVWIPERVAGPATAAALPVRRSGGPVPRVVVEDVADLRRLWAVFEGVAPPPAG